MATIQKRGQKWRVQVRRKSCPPQSRIFTHKADAQKWARHMETEADRKGLPVDRRELETLKVADLLMRYRETVTLTKRGQAPGDSTSWCADRGRNYHSPPYQAPTSRATGMNGLRRAS